MDTGSHWVVLIADPAGNRASIRGIFNTEREAQILCSELIELDVDPTEIILGRTGLKRGIQI